MIRIVLVLRDQLTFSVEFGWGYVDPLDLHTTVCNVCTPLNQYYVYVDISTLCIFKLRSRGHSFAFVSSSSLFGDDGNGDYSDDRQNA
jgi:hypothetical protein